MLRSARLRQGPQDDRELIATETGDGVVSLDATAQTLTDDRKHLIARGMAQGVVDLLKVVEVEIQQGAAEAALTHLLQLIGQSIAEQEPVRQAGELIEMRLTVQTLFTLAAGQCQR